MNLDDKVNSFLEALDRVGDARKYEPHPDSEVPQWKSDDSVCGCEGRPPHRVREDGFYICSACGGALLPSAITSIENNFTAGEPAETE